jgi:hypothetical protein
MNVLYHLLFKEILLGLEKLVLEHFSYTFGIILIPSIASIFINQKNLNIDLCKYLKINKKI